MTLGSTEGGFVLLLPPQICHSDGHETKWPTKHQSMDKKGWCCAKPVPQATPTHTKKSQVTGTAGKTYSEAILLNRNLPGHLMWMESYSMSRKSKSIDRKWINGSWCWAVGWVALLQMGAEIFWGWWKCSKIGMWVWLFNSVSIPKTTGLYP